MSLITTLFNNNDNNNNLNGLLDDVNQDIDRLWAVTLPDGKRRATTAWQPRVDIKVRISLVDFSQTIIILTFSSIGKR